MNRLTKKIFDKNTVDIFDVKELNWTDEDGGNAEGAYTGKAIDRLAEYEDLGTVGEVKKAIQKQIAILPNCEGSTNEAKDDVEIYCPKCGYYFENESSFCPDCGQRIEWL